MHLLKPCVKFVKTWYFAYFNSFMMEVPIIQKQVH